MKRSILIMLAIALSAGSAHAQAVEECGERFREFDFWVGQWTVTDQAGTVTQGQSSITLVASDCTIREQWTSGGGLGYSLNMYDPVRDDWTQVWMDDSGLELHLKGGLVDGAMVLTGEVFGQLQRITWTPLDGGVVRQHWEVSTDGANWTTSFDGYYQPPVQEAGRARGWSAAALAPREPRDGAAYGPGRYDMPAPASGRPTRLTPISAVSSNGPASRARRPAAARR